MISQSNLDKITQATTYVGSFKATLDALASDQTISHDVCGLVKLALDQAAVRLNPAIAANARPVANVSAAGGVQGAIAGKTGTAPNSERTPDGRIDLTGAEQSKGTPALHRP